MSEGKEPIVTLEMALEANDMQEETIKKLRQELRDISADHRAKMRSANEYVRSLRAELEELKLSVKDANRAASVLARALDEAYARIDADDDGDDR